MTKPQEFEPSNMFTTQVGALWKSEQNLGNLGFQLGGGGGHGGAAAEQQPFEVPYFDTSHEKVETRDNELVPPSLSDLLFKIDSGEIEVVSVDADVAQEMDARRERETLQTAARAAAAPARVAQQQDSSPEQAQRLQQMRHEQILKEQQLASEIHLQRLLVEQRATALAHHQAQMAEAERGMGGVHLQQHRQGQQQASGAPPATSLSASGSAWTPGVGAFGGGGAGGGAGGGGASAFPVGGAASAPAFGMARFEPSRRPYETYEYGPGPAPAPAPYGGPQSGVGIPPGGTMGGAAYGQHGGARGAMQEAGYYFVDGHPVHPMQMQQRLQQQAHEQQHHHQHQQQQQRQQQQQHRTHGGRGGGGGRDGVAQRYRGRGGARERNGGGQQRGGGGRSGNGNTSDKIVVPKIQQGVEQRRTVMIRNIPNRYTRKLLRRLLDDKVAACYDFLYLPIDFTNGCNMGYAFINMVNAEAIVKLHNAFHRSRWPKFRSSKVCSLCFARVQGKAALINLFERCVVTIFCSLLLLLLLLPTPPLACVAHTNCCPPPTRTHVILSPS